MKICIAVACGFECAHLVEGKPSTAEQHSSTAGSTYVDINTDFYEVSLQMPLFLETTGCFHLSPSGGMILAADYSQLELRLLAHLSKDQRLLQVSGSSRKSRLTSV